MNELKQQMGQMFPALVTEMKTVLNAKKETPNQYWGMMHYHMGWRDEEMNPADINAGKRIRPLLCMLICAAAGGDWRKAIPAASAIEILHNFSLVHDDIEDVSPTRRGRNTVWKIWGVQQGINTGDAMFALAHIALNRLIEVGVPAETVVKALRRFDETCVDLTYGQHLDMSFETRDSVTVDEYIEMITGKTAVLVSLSAELGAMIAGCDEKTVQNYKTFGHDIGLAFQVKDDILGIWGDEELTGKSAATDILTKKKTLPVLFGLQKSEALRQLYDQTEEPDQAFVQQAITLLDESGANDYVAEKDQHYTNNALTHLATANPQGPAATAVQQLVDMLLHRQH